MLVTVKMLSLFLMALTISGCSHKLIYVPTSCNINSIDEPLIDLVDKNTTLGEAKRCAKNYTLYKEAFEKQKKIIEVCK